MSYGIATAGTGGHVYPGLAIAEALERAGVGREEILFFGGERFEAGAVPAAGYDFVQVELRGLKRSFSSANLGIPVVVHRAATKIAEELRRRKVKVVVATGGYVTVPAGWAAHQAKVPFFVQEQNAHAGLANRIMSRWAVDAFTSFPTTEGLPNGLYTGNPLRSGFVEFDRIRLRPLALERYGLNPNTPVLGVVGGSLGAAALNEAVQSLVRTWSGPDIQILHLTGTLHGDTVSAQPNPFEIPWKVVPFEPSMDLFFAASDLLLARAGGMVAEITATGTPAILVPGDFGSKGHQLATAQFVEQAGGAIVVNQDDLNDIAERIVELVGDSERIHRMAERSKALGRPHAADDIAARMVAAHG